MALRVCSVISNCTGRPRLFLNHSRSVANYASADHVIDRQPHEIATPELAIDGQVEHREIPPASFQLQANTNGPDVLRL
jgi:hypothetical protein